MDPNHAPTPDPSGDPSSFRPGADPSSPRTLLGRWGATLAIGAGLWLLPAPEGVSEHGANLLAVFVATVASFLLRPLPMGPMVLLALVVLSATGTLEYRSLISGYGNATVWLVVAAFLIAGSVDRSGLGRRIALTLVRRLGRSTLGLGYAICGAELCLGPVVPSNTARGGGIVAPIVRSLAVALTGGAGGRTTGTAGYLVLVGAHANLITAAMFLTGMAANPLVAAAASEVLGIEFGWGTWALAGIVPGLLGLALLPLLLLRLAPPDGADVRAARAIAGQELAAMGGWSRAQRITAGVCLLLLALWSTQGLHGLGTGLVAWIGVCALLVLRVDHWDDLTGDSGAWDALMWLGGILAMANALADQGVVDWFAGWVEGGVAGLSGIAVVLALALVYFYSMYGFSMLTAHISAMVGAFFVVARTAEAPPLVTAALFAAFGNLCACTTNYSTGPVIIYFGLGHVPVGRWFRVGFLVSLFHIALWSGVGLAWWKLLGWW